MLKKSLLLVLLIAVVGGLYWTQSQPKTYQLLVRNSSQEPVSEVRLFGSSVHSGKALQDIPPGHGGLLEVQLGQPGDLRVEVITPSSKIDTYIHQDVTKLKFYQQRLDIQPGNHFIISEVPLGETPPGETPLEE